MLLDTLHVLNTVHAVCFMQDLSIYKLKRYTNTTMPIFHKINWRFSDFWQIF